MKIGVVAIQGAVAEHIEMAERALSEMGLSGSAVKVRAPVDLESVSALIIPGGESTTIGKTMKRNGLYDRIKKLADEGMPIMGTCAGCILMAAEGDGQVERTQTPLLALMDMAVDRNAFGRQKDSFERTVMIEGIGEFPAVFIRAPLITRVWGKCIELARVYEGIVMAKQENMLALAFHPELTNNTLIHRMMIEMI